MPSASAAVREALGVRRIGVALAASRCACSRPSGYRAAGALAVPAVLLGGFGIALVILLWSAVRLPEPLPRRAVLFGVHDGRRSSIFVQGLLLPWLGAVVLVPVVSLARLRGGSARCPPASFRAPSRRSFRSLGRSCCSWHLRVRVRGEGIVDVPVDVRRIRRSARWRWPPSCSSASSRAATVRLRRDLPRVAAHGGGFPHLAERGRPGAGRVRFLHECVLPRSPSHHAHHG
ncbi:MAG: hypothetical protein ACLT98_15990 [Eggerthellaceae bacterium]